MSLLRETNKRDFQPFPAKFFFAACFFCVLLSMPAFAKTLIVYKENVEQARNLTLQMLYPDEEILDSYDRYAEFEKSALAQIRKIIPPSEKIEWENSFIETDNRWLGEKLDAYQKEPEDSETREQILTEISDRLDAIRKKISELENAAALTRTKDEDKRKLAEILRREEYKKADEKEKSLFRRIYDAVIKWLNELIPPGINNPAQSSTGFGQLASVLVYIFFALILGGIGYLIYKFAPAFISRFRAREKREKTERVILGETLAADENAAALFGEAEKLAREGNLRAAIRKGYIALLCELADRRVIALSRHKTNRDYLRDVRRAPGGGGELYRNMNGLTLDFERHWYGFETADAEDWEEFKSNYKKAVRGAI